ncbi:Rieske (2Fe-2S) protein [Streptomyces hesseae]|uniref:Cytochrome bc1 complex Rieske iron-sulfur subunit n=1 Tax=Streptomyces hesseae TaxID=3075519 RepID=A0ABU2SUN4_9ACTN|nr:Rieske (2Fe-2S) protein [Streptomyces sp. DSM 40473]MDT0452724.1 Rieske (2Fe-2S) protein [Streptomyces sp. DSM 40473]
MTHSSPAPSTPSAPADPADPAAPAGPVRATRRAVVAATGAAGLAAVLAACGGSDDAGSGSGYSGDVPDTSDAPKGTPGQAGGDKGTPGTGATSGAGAGAGAALARTSEIPEGGGKVFPDRKVVVTQPSKGRFKAFSAVCTHQGCVVKDVANGTINCPCHGSRFSVTDGAVRGGPAQKPLPEERISVNGDSITLG